jgi:tripartite-type tricarboxylate transporter receptor subunit TctC
MSLVADLASTAQFVRQNKFKVLATASLNRSKGWENIPTLAESLPGFDMTGWFSVVAPKGAPQSILESNESALLIKLSWIRRLLNASQVSVLLLILQCP